MQNVGGDINGLVSVKLGLYCIGMCMYRGAGSWARGRKEQRG